MSDLWVNLGRSPQLPKPHCSQLWSWGSKPGSLHTWRWLHQMTGQSRHLTPAGSDGDNSPQFVTQCFLSLLSLYKDGESLLYNPLPWYFKAVIKKSLTPFTILSEFVSSPLFPGALIDPLLFSCSFVFHFQYSSRRVTLKLPREPV